MTRIKIGNVRTPIAYLEQYFAPAGYGLGKHAPIITDLDTQYVCGWFNFGEDANSSPFPYGGVLLVLSKGTSFIQLAFNSVSADWGGAGGIARRIGGETNWHPWEYINPPMMPGVEYRTTERWNGKAVYTILVNFGALPNNTEKSFWCEINGATAVVDYSVVTRNVDGDVFCNASMMSSVTGSWAKLNESGNIGLYITTNTDASNLTAECIIRYTKD